ncbi:MAG: hypothetical protein K2H50_06885 [Paramuribaculum sp.]|nr:hypothetical protein [Paramuribaculum sp.]
MLGYSQARSCGAEVAPAMKRIFDARLGCAGYHHHSGGAGELIHGRHDTSCSCKWVLIFRMLLSPVPFCTSLK